MSPMPRSSARTTSTFGRDILRAASPPRVAALPQNRRINQQRLYRYLSHEQTTVRKPAADRQTDTETRASVCGRNKGHTARRVHARSRAGAYFLIILRNQNKFTRPLETRTLATIVQPHMHQGLTKDEVFQERVHRLRVVEVRRVSAAFHLAHSHALRQVALERVRVTQRQDIILASPDHQGGLGHRACSLRPNAARHAPRAQVKQRGIVAAGLVTVQRDDARLVVGQLRLLIVSIARVSIAGPSASASTPSAQLPTHAPHRRLYLLYEQAGQPRLHALKE